MPHRVLERRRPALRARGARRARSGLRGAAQCTEWATRLAARGAAQSRARRSLLATWARK